MSHLRQFYHFLNAKSGFAKSGLEGTPLEGGVSKKVVEYVLLGRYTNDSSNSGGGTDE